MSADRNRLEALLARLRDLERCLVPPHERPILDVARAALADEIRVLSHRLHDGDYWRTQVRTRVAG